MKYRTASLGDGVFCAPARLGSNSSNGADSKTLRVIPITLPLSAEVIDCASECGVEVSRVPRRRAIVRQTKAASSFFRDKDGDRLGCDRWIEWVMLGIAQHQLQRVFAGWQFNERFGFPFAEMNM